MSVKEWFDKKVFWELTIRAADVASLMVPSSAPGKNRFKLKPAKKKGKVVYFTVAYKPGALPAVWKKVTLFPRGTTPAAPPPALPAQPTDLDLLAAIATVKTQLQNCGSTTERLEGEIDVKIDAKTERASLTLVQIPKAVNGEALLCLFTTFDANPGGSLPSPDGSGGGSSGSN
jgi:hypothetical protein